MTKSFLITGASNGLGLKLTLEIAEIANSIIIVSRNILKLSKLENKIKKINPSVIVFKIVSDLSTINGAKKIINEFKNQNKIKKIDVLINSAANFRVKKIRDITVKNLLEDFQLNVITPFLLSQYFSIDMCKKKNGIIVNIGSSSSYSSSKNTSVYCATKHALLGMSRSFHVELREHNVRSIIVSPGSMKTSMGKKVKNQDYSTFIDPKDVARMIKQVIIDQNNMVIDEIKLNRMQYK